MSHSAFLLSQNYERCIHDLKAGGTVPFGSNSLVFGGATTLRLVVADAQSAHFEIEVWWVWAGVLPLVPTARVVGRLYRLPDDGATLSLRWVFITWQFLFLILGASGLSLLLLRLHWRAGAVAAIILLLWAVAQSSFALRHIDKSLQKRFGNARPYKR